MDILLEDILILARTVWGEASGESYMGKKAVAHVIINRYNHKTGDKDHTLAATALRWYQFSAWNEKDKYNDGNRRSQVFKINVDSRTFRECMKAVLEALDEEDFTHGARWYYADYIAKPRWANELTEVGRIGRHIFFA